MPTPQHLALNRAGQSFKRNRLEQAERICRTVLTPKSARDKLTRDHQRALQMLGLIEQKRGRLARAIALFTAALKIDASQKQCLFKLGVIYQSAGQPDKAAACYQRAVKLDPKYSAAYNNMGTLLLRAGKLVPAGRCFRQALKLTPRYADAHANLAAVLLELGKADAAVRHCRRAIALKPRAANYHTGLGNALRALGKADLAVRAYAQALRLSRKHAPTHLALGALRRDQGRLVLSMRHQRIAAQLEPKNPEALRSLGVSYLESGQYDLATDCFNRTLKLRPSDAGATACLAMVHERRGDPRKAWALLEPLITTGKPDSNTALALAGIARHVKQEDAALKLIDQLLERREPRPLDAAPRLLLHFAAGKMLDALGRYDEAFSHYQRGNALKPFRFDRPRFEKLIDDLIGAFSEKAMPALARASGAAPTRNRPLFIVGVPRSGTSLVEQVLGSHPQVRPAGELRAMLSISGNMHRLMRSPKAYPLCMDAFTPRVADLLARTYLDVIDRLDPTAARVTDKLPGNFLNLGLIELLMPLEAGGARVVHVVRDPLDTCLSCYFQNFASRHTYAYDLAALGQYYRGYQRLLRHWQCVLKTPIYTVKYEDLVRKPQAQIKKLVEFAGLPWDERCLKFHQTQRDVATCSYDQVRQPMYTSSIGRWKHYEKHLAPLREALGA